MNIRSKAFIIILCLLSSSGQARAQEQSFEQLFYVQGRAAIKAEIESLRNTVQAQSNTIQKLSQDLASVSKTLKVRSSQPSLLLLLILTNFGLLAFLALTLLKPRMRRAERAAAEREAAKLEARLKNLETVGAAPRVEFELLEARLDRTTQAMAAEVEQQVRPLLERISGLERRVPEPPPPSPELDRIAQELENYKRLAMSVHQKVEALAAARSEIPTLPPVKSLDLERDVLREIWNKSRENREIQAALENAQDRRWEEIRDPLLSELPRSVPEELRPTFVTVLAPARDFYTLVNKINLVPRLLGDKPEDRLEPLPTEAQELMRLRELVNLLTMIQNSNLMADRLNFRLERWIVDHFLAFADLFLQRYQQAQMEHGAARLEPGVQIVRRVLKLADLEPVDLTLGVTPFDSTRHIGRSTASDPSFASGIIVGVVRNGFVRGGQQVIRQPEVIVNRVA